MADADPPPDEPTSPFARVLLPVDDVDCSVILSERKRQRGLRERLSG